MIYFENLKFDLLKASLDKSKLVLIQTEDIINGKAVITHHWEDPNKVKSHHKVLYGHHNLPATHPKKTDSPVEVKPPSNLPINTAYSKEMKDKTKAFYETFANREEFFDALKALNLHWEEHPHAGINLMRAKSRVTAAISQGFDPFNPHEKIDVSKIPSPARVSSTPTPTKKVVGAAANTRIKLSDESTKEANKFFQEECKGDRQTFYNKLQEFGISYVISSEDKTQFMFAKRALIAEIENGFDPYNPTVKSTPKPSQQQKIEQSFLDESQATNEREKHWIKFINQMTDIESIQKCAKLGFIPQDSRSEKFITQKLLPEFALAILNPDNSEWFKSIDKTGKQHIPYELRKTIKDAWGPMLKELALQVPGQVTTKPVYNVSEGELSFGKAMANQLDFLGCKKSCIIEGFKQMGRFSMIHLVESRRGLGLSGEFMPLHSIFSSLNEGFSDYVTDDYPDKYKSNLGYTGYDPEEYHKRFSLEQEGVVRQLRKISSDNPELTQQCDKMANTYNQMITLANHNPETLNLILSTGTWTDKTAQRISVSKFGRQRLKTLPEIRKAIQLADNLSNIVISELTQRGYSSQSIIKALKNGEINDSLQNFEIENNKGSVDTIDFTTLTDSNGKLLVNPNKGEHLWGTGMMYYTQSKYLQQNGVSLESQSDFEEMKNVMDYYKELKSIVAISDDTYKQIHKLATEFFGLKYMNKKTGEEVNIDSVDVKHQWLDDKKERHDWNDYTVYKLAPTDTNPEFNTVVANLIMGKLHYDVHSGIASTITNNAASGYNNNGSDYSGNFTYYSGGVMKNADSTLRIAQYGNTGKNAVTLTAQELKDKITQQLAETPNISSNYIQTLQQYYKSTGIRSNLDSIKSKWGYTPDSYLDSPIKDIIYNMSQSVALHIPECTSKVFFKKFMSKRLDYVPFDFNSKTQGRFNKPKVEQKQEPTPEELKQARQDLFKSAHCSLKTLREQETLEYWSELMSKSFDYKRGEKTPDGEVMIPVHSLVDKNGERIRTQKFDPAYKTYNKVALLNSPIFQVEDSVMEEKFNQKQEEIKAQYPDKPDRYKVMDVYAGAPIWSAANIMGRTGEFYTGEDSSVIGKSLGPGIHVSNKIGDCLFSACNDVGSGQRVERLSNGQAEGIVFMMNAIRGGKPSTRGTTVVKNSTYTSISMDAVAPKYYKQYAASNANVPKDWGMILRDSGLANVHHFADISSRTIGLNTQLDDMGYHDSKGIVTHDSNGINVNIDWG